MNNSGRIRVAIAGLGNCASSLVEGVHFYRQNPETEAGLLFPILSSYSVRDIEVVAAFDISALKVGCRSRKRFTRRRIILSAFLE